MTASGANVYLAFYVRAQLYYRRNGMTTGDDNDDDDRILPVWWSDNYINLLPGEKRVLTAEYEDRNAVSGNNNNNEEKVEVRVDGWNVHPIDVIMRVPIEETGMRSVADDGDGTKTLIS